jgi:hypothetical protein
VRCVEKQKTVRSLSAITLSAALHVVDFGETWKEIRAYVIEGVDGLYIEASNGKNAMVGCGRGQCSNAKILSYEQASQ